MIQFLFIFCISISSLYCSEKSYEKKRQNEFLIRLCSIAHEYKDALNPIKALVAGGADINYTTSGNVTALHITASNGCLEAVRFLLEQKQEPIDINAKTAVGLTPLHGAAQRGVYYHCKASYRKWSSCR